MRILVVEDDARIAQPLAAGLRLDKHIVDVGEDGYRALALAEAAPYDVAVLDLMLPGLSGVEVCRTLRRRGLPTMIIMLTARDGLKDKLEALDTGADDYVVKPVDIAEISARIRALSRRAYALREPSLQHGALCLRPHRGEATYAGRPLELTRIEFTLLETFLRDPKRIFSRPVLHGRVAGIDKIGNPDTVKTHLTNLRKKIRAGGCPNDPIVAVHGFGYRLADGL